MLAADEVVLAGISYNDSSQNPYLITEGYYFWTMTPFYQYSSSHYNFVVRSTLNLAAVSQEYAVRPSIALKPGTWVYGEGTKRYPYEVVMD